jgi:hypothetical protein
MERKNVKLGMIVLLAGMLLVAMVAVSGCKKSTPTSPTTVKPAATAPEEAKKVVAGVDANKVAEVQKAATETVKTTTEAAKDASKAATDAAKTVAESNALPKVQ